MGLQAKRERAGTILLVMSFKLSVLMNGDVLWSTLLTCNSLPQKRRCSRLSLLDEESHKMSLVTTREKAVLKLRLTLIAASVNHYKQVPRVGCFT